MLLNDPRNLLPMAGKRLPLLPRQPIAASKRLKK
jgi:hypothetical protein